MPQPQIKLAYTLSTIIVILAAAASTGGLLLKDLYQDNAFVKTAWYGNDLVTLFAAVPVMVAMMVLSRRGSLKAQLVWFGLLGYMLYNYAFYLFGAAFNRFFLIFVAIFALSIYALVFGLSSIDASAVRQKFGPRTPVRWIGGFMVFVGLFMTVVEIAMTMGYLTSGQLPQIVVDSGHPTSIVFALDLSMALPGMILFGILLWKRQPWGFVMGPMFLIKGIAYMLVLLTSTVLGNYDALTPFYIFVLTGCLASLGFLLRNIAPVEKQTLAFETR